MSPALNVAARPRVWVISLGGTITMTAQDGEGIRPSLSAPQLLAAEPRLADIAELEAWTPFTLPGASLTLTHLMEVAAAIQARVGASAGDNVPDGVVVVQGTDTIEDTAFVLDLTLDVDCPVVVTGAMRGPQAPGADGTANLLAAAIAAADPRLRRVGAVVVLNDQIHAAAWTRKSHTSLPSAFTSPAAGPIGWVAEGRVRLAMRPERPRLPRLHALPAASRATWPRVAQVSLGLGEDGALLHALPGLGYAGVVIEAMGAGHVPAACVEALREIAGQMPVILSTRVPAGVVFRNTYGFEGSERDLLSRGLLSCGSLPASKARLLLAMLLASDSGAQEIATAFDAFAFG